MSILRLAGNELRRLTSGRLPKLAMLALLIVPLLYGAMYVYANWDPYGRLGKVPAALVDQDAGAQTPDGQSLDAGHKVADRLEDSGKFDWHRVSPQEAHDGVRDGTYAFSLTLPKGFSRALTSSTADNPRKGMLTLTTNDANNYLVRTIADNVVSEVRKAVAREVGTEAAKRLLTGYSTIHDQLAKAVGGADRLAGGSKDLTTAQRKLRDGATEAASGAGALSSGLDTLREKTADLPDKSAELASGAKQVAAGTAKVSGTADAVSNAADDFVASLDETNGTIADKLRAQGFDEDQVDTVMSTLGRLRAPVDAAHEKVSDAGQRLDELNSGAQRVSSGAAALAASAPALADGIDDAADGANALAHGTDKLRDGENSAVAGTHKLSNGAGELEKKLKQGLGQVPNPDAQARDNTAKTIADPTAVHNVGNAQAATYGAGLAPFFLALAAWIGGFVLFLLFRPLSRRALAAGRRAWKTVLAGWLPVAAMGVVQMVILYLVVTFAVGLRPAYWFATFGFLVFSSIAFIGLLHGLNALFGAVGKFLGLLLLILQLVSAGGTFPWQTIPDVLYPLHYLLPMSYVVDGLRHLIYGGGLAGVGIDVAVLAGWLLLGLLLSLLAARRQRVWTPSVLKPELAL